MSSIHSSFTELLEVVKPYRSSENDVHPLFLNRWSHRDYSDRKVSDQDLHKVLEAGHWAPSSWNDQPWRFYVAKTPERLKLFHSFIMEPNSWSFKAPVLILMASDKNRLTSEPNGAHAFDTGAAWGYMALQAKMLGMDTCAMGGIYGDKARDVLKVPDHFAIHCLVALGYQVDNYQPSGMSTRLPLSEVIY